MTEAMQRGTEKPEAFGNGNADGDNQRNCADRGAHGERYKTADDEKHRNRELRRNQRENEVGNAVCGGSADNADKNPCQHEDENHRDNIRVADAGAHNGKLIIERQGAVLQTGNKQGNQKYDNNRDFDKSPFRCSRPYSNNMPRPNIKQQIRIWEAMPSRFSFPFSSSFPCDKITKFLIKIPFFYSNLHDTSIGISRSFGKICCITSFIS